jgi:hypothetical protein
MSRCPDCPRVDLLKRLTCVRSERGNVGREFVKCESKPYLGPDGKVGLPDLTRFGNLDLGIWEFGFPIFFSGIG